MLLLYMHSSAVTVSSKPAYDFELFIGCICSSQLAELRLCSAQAPWSEFMQDDAVKNNTTRQFCTEALQIDVPHERMSDR